jgi:hypothetical protein
MPVLPSNRVDQIQFCENHYPAWEGSPASIGLLPGTVAAFKALTTAARESYNESQAARDASKAATGTFYSKTGLMRDDAADLIRQIKAYAESRPTEAERDAVYAKAQIERAAPPTPMTAPGKPTDININLEPSGAVTITWSAENASAGTGGFFNITRKLPGQNTFGLVGGSPGTTTEARTMTFTDYSIPTSAAGQGAQYIIQGRRGQLMGEASDPFVVQFGVDGAGMSVSGGASIKIAA